jgi:hypothetical protein
MSSSLQPTRVTLLLALLIALAVGGAYFAFDQGLVHWPKPAPRETSAGPDLKSAVEEVDRIDPGWRFDELNAHRAEVPANENAAPVVRAAFSAIPADWPRQSIKDELNALPSYLSALSKQQSSEVAEELTKAAAALTEARKLAALPRGRYAVDWKPDCLSTELPHLQQMQKVETLLAWDAINHMQENDPAAALASTRSILNAGRSVGDEPTLQSCLIRAESHLLMMQMLERTLSQTQPDEAALAAMQRAVEEECAVPLLLVAARGERAGIHALLWAFEEGRLKTSDLASSGDISQQTLGDKLLVVLHDKNLSARPTFEQSHAWLLLYLTEFIEITKLPFEQQRPRLEKLDARRANAPTAAHKLMPATRSTIILFQKSQALLRTAAVALALERHRLAKGTWPENLTDIAPECLHAVPADPFDGKPLRYKKKAEGVVVYSIGPDGKDDGGDFAKVNTFLERTDIGCRLWNADKRQAGKKP